MSHRSVRVIGLAAGLTCLAALVPGPAAGAQPTGSGDRADPDPGATTVRGRCLGGGRVKVTVRGLTDAGTYPVEVDVRNVAGRTEWDGRVIATSGKNRVRDKFDGIVATGGTWTFSTSLEPQGRRTDFTVVARSDDSDRFCLLQVFPTDRFHGGLSVCRPRLISALALRRRDDGDLGVGFFALPLRNADGERWRVDFRVSGAGGSQQVTVHDRAGQGFLITRAVLQGFDDPRVYVEATDEAGRRCSMGVNASEVTTEPLPSAATVRRELRQLRG